jgi:hypothetical protein
MSFSTYDRGLKIAAIRGITITKITAIIIMGNGDHYERDDVNPFWDLNMIFPKHKIGRNGVWRWSDRAWEGGIQTKPKILSVISL